MEPDGQPYYLAVSLVCLILIIPLYVFYEVLPVFFALNISYIQSLLPLYAGANLFSALFGNKKRRIVDNVSLKAK